MLRNTESPGGTQEIFISHSEEPLAIEMRETIRQVSDGRIGTFVSGRDIRTGDDFRTAIQRAMQRSCALVCLVTQESLIRPWVNYELGLADAIGIPVLMVMIEGSDIPTHPVGNRQLTRCTNDGVAGLLNQLLGFAGIQPREDIRPFATLLVQQWGQILREETQLRRTHLSVIQSHLNDWNQAANEELRNAPLLLEDEYLRAFESALDALPSGATLLAVCGDKTWTHQPVFEYLKKNTDIAVKGVHVHRVYVEPSGGFHPAENALIQRHLEWARSSDHFDISVILGNKATSLRDDFGLPDGFGLVMPLGTTPLAMMHYGLGDNRRRARIFRNPWIVDIYKWIHRRLAANGVTDGQLDAYLAREDTRKDYDMVNGFIPLPPKRR